ncbi:MAG: prepilin-type N-terminal cleavage/methylation domain-containing protein [Gemmatimonadota bacterium]|nr:prepilin-type N-terminal cleavage/methylation domain-containing protein [Gemmatimonadota bacterium]
MNRRTGFTLIELVFAVFVFSVGALGLAATSAVILRSLSVSSARERASRLASNRIETMRSFACGAARSGSEIRGGMTSVWTVSRSASGLDAVVSVSYVAGGSTRRETIASTIPCAP